MTYVSDIAYGKRVKTPRMKRKERVTKVKAFTKKAAIATGRGAKKFGKDVYATGKYVYRDVKRKSKKRIKLKKRKKVSYPAYISGNFNFGKETIGL